MHMSWDSYTVAANGNNVQHDWSSCHFVAEYLMAADVNVAKKIVTLKNICRN